MDTHRTKVVACAVEQLFSFAFFFVFSFSRALSKTPTIADFISRFQILHDSLSLSLSLFLSCI